MAVASLAAPGRRLNARFDRLRCGKLSRGGGVGKIECYAKRLEH